MFMKLKNELLYPILIISACLLMLPIGCEKNDDDENDNENGDIEHEITYGSVTDKDGNEYTTVFIGDQEWMAENLRVTQYNNGDQIPSGLSDEEWENTADGAYSIYPHTGGINDNNVEGIDSDEEMAAAYGYLYNWHAVNDSRGLCPQGWHVATNADFKELTDYLLDNFDAITSYNLANKLKSCRQVNSPLGDDCATNVHPRWDQYETDYGTNNFGFSGLPAGGRGEDGIFYGIGFGGFWWTADEFDDDVAFGWHMRATHGGVDDDGGTEKYKGFSIRCIKD